MEDNSTQSSAPSARGESAADASQRSPIPNWRGFLVLLPGLFTLVMWELAAWQWSTVARLVSQPPEIARGILDPRHVDPIWPLWNLFDFTPEGRGTNWYPKLSYDAPTVQEIRKSGRS